MYVCACETSLIIYVVQHSSPTTDALNGVIYVQKDYYPAETKQN